jgi:hypothetical protein
MGGYYNLPGLKPPNRRPPTPKTPQSGTDASGNPLKLEVYNDNTFGFLRLTVSSTSVVGVFVTVDPKSGKSGVGDSFTIDLGTNKVSSSGSRGTSTPARKRAASSKAKRASAKQPKAKSKSTVARTKRR